MKLLKTYVYYIEFNINSDGYYTFRGKTFRFKVEPSPNKSILDITSCIEKYLINKSFTFDKKKSIQLCSVKEEIIYNEIISDNEYEYELGEIVKYSTISPKCDIVEYNKVETVKLRDFSKDFNMSLYISYISLVLEDLKTFKILDMGNFTHRELSYDDIKDINCQKVILPKNLASLRLGSSFGYDYYSIRTRLKEIDFSNNDNLVLTLFKNSKRSISKLSFLNFSNNTEIELGSTYYLKHYPEKTNTEYYILNNSLCLKNLAFKNNFESTFKKEKEKCIKEKEEKERHIKEKELKKELEKELEKEKYPTVIHDIDYVSLFNGSNISSVCNPIPYSERLISEAIDEYYQNVVRADEW